MRFIKDATDSNQYYQLDLVAKIVLVGANTINYLSHDGGVLWIEILANDSARTQRVKDVFAQTNTYASEYPQGE